MKMPPISLENLGDTEKDQLASLAKKKLNKSLIMFGPAFLLFGYTVYYLNAHYMGLGLENPDLRSFLNVALVILAVLAARLMMSAVLQQRKALNAWQKKVFRGPIQAISAGSVVIVNQKIKVSAAQLGDVKVGDEVELATNASGDVFLYVRKSS